MDTEQFWDKFAESGSIYDYIEYINKRDSCDDND